MRIFPLVLTVVILGACATTRVQDGVYRSPLGNFSVQVPRFMFTTYVDENVGEDGGIVGFSGDMGSVMRIEFERIPVEARAAFDVADTRDLAYRDYLGMVVAPRLRQMFPGTEVLHEEFVADSLGRAYFGVVHVPGGSPLRDMRENRNLDSTLTMLIFHQGAFVYVIHAGTGDAFGPTPEPRPASAAWSPEIVLDYRSQIDFDIRPPEGL